MYNNNSKRSKRRTSASNSHKQTNKQRTFLQKKNWLKEDQKQQ